MKPLTIKAHERPVVLVRFNKDGDLFFTASLDGKVCAFWAESGERLGTYSTESTAAIRAMTISHDSKYLLVGKRDGQVTIFNVEDGTLLQEFYGPSIMIHALEFNMSSQQFLLLAGVGAGKKHSAIHIYDLQDVLNSPKGDSINGKEITRRTVANFTTATWGYLNETVLVGTDAGTVEIIDAATGQVRKEEPLHKEPVTSLRMSADYSLIISSSRDCVAKIIDPYTLTVITEFNAQRPLNTAVISPLYLSEESGKRKFHALVAGGQDVRQVTTTAADQGGFEVTFFNMVTGKEVASIKGHFGPVHSVDVHPSGRCFVSVSEDGHARVNELDEEYFSSEFD